MATITESLFGPSNRRRCVKGRSSYAESVDNLLSNDDSKYNEFSCSEKNDFEIEENIEQQEEEVDEEPVTIDLSAFLQENPLLTESAAENAIDSGAGLSDCHSQFRVTSILETTPILVDSNNQKEFSNSETNPLENLASSISVDYSLDVSNSSPDIISPSFQHNIASEVKAKKNKLILDVKCPKKYESPKKYMKPKSPLGFSNPVRKYRNFSKMKDFIKNNIKFFGKYPIVKCEKLDIENYVKKNNIKVSNWPLSHSNTFKKKCLNTGIKKKARSKTDSKAPAFFHPISFNKSRNTKTNQNSSLLIKSLQSKPITSESFKPDSRSIPLFLNNVMEKSGSPIPMPRSIIKQSIVGNERLIRIVSPNITSQHTNCTNNIQNSNLPVITTQNKVNDNHKAFQIISSNPYLKSLSTKKIKTVSPISPKPIAKCYFSPVKKNNSSLSDSYSENPNSVTPKQILPMSLEIPVSDEQKIDSFELEYSPSKSVTKLLKSDKSSVKKLSPMKLSDDVISNENLKQINIPIHRNFVNYKTNDQVTESLTDKNLKETVSSSSADLIVDAIEKAFTTQIKKSPRSKPLINKIEKQVNQVSDILNAECQTYNSTLNSILFGFATSDFTDDLYLNNIGNESEPNDSDPLTENIKSDDLKSNDNSEPSKVISIYKYKRKENISNPKDSDTASASEGEHDNKCTTVKKISTIKDNKSVKTISKKEKFMLNKEIDPHVQETLVDTNNPKETIPSDLKEKVLTKVSDLQNISEMQQKHTDLNLSNNIDEDKISPEVTQETVVKPPINSPRSSARNFDLLKESKLVDKKFQRENFERVTDVPENKEEYTTASVVKKKRKNLNRMQHKLRKISAQKSKVKKKFSRRADIIQEIKTITGGRVLKNQKLAIVKKTPLNAKTLKPETLHSKSSENNNSKKIVKSTYKNKRKRIKTLKVLFKSPKSDTYTTCVNSDLNDNDLSVFDSVSKTSELASNISLHSTFREGINKMGTPNDDGLVHDTNAITLEQKQETQEDGYSIKDENVLSSKGDVNNVPQNPKISAVVSAGTILDNLTSIARAVNQSELGESDFVETNQISVVNQVCNLSNENKEPLFDKNTMNKQTSLVLDELKITNNALNQKEENPCDVSLMNDIKAVIMQLENEVCDQEKITSYSDNSVDLLPRISGEYCSNEVFNSVQDEQSFDRDLKDISNIFVNPVLDQSSSPVEFIQVSDEVRFEVNLSEAIIKDVANELLSLVSDNICKDMVIKSHENNSNSSNLLLESERSINTELKSPDSLNSVYEAPDTVNENEADMFADQASCNSNISKNSQAKCKRKNLEHKKTSRKKSCPKIKLSVSKNDDCAKKKSFERWYVSERKCSTDSTSESVDSISTLCENSGEKNLWYISDKTESHNVAENELNELSVSDNATSFSLTIKNSKNDNSDQNYTSDKSGEKKSLANDETVSEDLSVLPAIIKEEPVDIEVTSDSDYPSSLSLNIKIEPENIQEANSTDVAFTKKSRRFTKKKVLKSPPLKSDTVDVSKIVTKENMVKKEKPNSKVQISVGMSSPVIQKQRKKNFSLDAVAVPFKMGWMRELVHRANEGKMGKRMSDVYYFAPEGTKLRSMPDISNYLIKHHISDLTIANFTFSKELVYREPFEIERSAKQKSISSPSPAKLKLTSPLKKVLTPEKTVPTASGSTRKKANLSFSSEISSPVAEKASDSKNPKNRIKSPTGTASEMKKKLDNSSPQIKTKEHQKLSQNKKRNSDINVINTEGNISTFSDSVLLRKSSPLKKRKKIVCDTSSDSKSSVRRSNRLSDSSTDINLPDLDIPSPKKIQKLSDVGEISFSQINNVDSSFSEQKFTVKKPLRVKFPFHKSQVLMQEPCTSRCNAAKIQDPEIKCAVCLCFFHESCIPVFSKGLEFICKPCATNKLAYYEELRKGTLSCAESSLSEEIDVPQLPEDVDLSLLYPSMRLQVQATKHLVQTSFDNDDVLNSTRILTTASSSNPSSDTSYFKASYDESKKTLFFASPMLLSHLTRPSIFCSNAVVLPQQSTPVFSVRTMQGTLPHLPIFQKNLNCSKPFIPIGTRLPINAPNSCGFQNPVVIRKLPQQGFVVHSSPNIQTMTRIVPNSAPSNAASRLPQQTQIQLPVGNTCTINFDISRQTSNVSGAEKNKDIPFRSYSNLSKCLSPSINQKEVKISKMWSSNCDEEQVAMSPLLLNKITTLTTSSQFLEKEEKLVTPTPSWDMNSLLRGYECLNLIFKKLDVHSLLKARLVCQSWKFLASQEHMWENVSFRSLRVTNWEKCCSFLIKQGTKTLDLCDIVLDNFVDPWKGFKLVLIKLSTVQELMFDKAQPTLLNSVAAFMPQLVKLECLLTSVFTEPDMWCLPCEFELSYLRNLSKLQTLKIGSLGGIILQKNPKYQMPYLPYLRYLSLTGFKFQSVNNLEALGKQQHLVTLELGDCSNVEPEIYDVLKKLTNIQNLRLENGGCIHDCKMSAALSNMKKLEQLELMNFKIPTTLSESIKQLKQLVRVNMWPNNTEQGALVNYNLFQTISSCKKLKYICWGIIAEGDSVPQVLEIQNTLQEESKTEISFKELFDKLVCLVSDCRVEVKCVPRATWREFCNARK